MPSERKPSLILPVAVTLAVLLGLYVGAYYWFVEDVKVSSYPAGGTPHTEMVPLYRVPARPGYGLSFFAPIHWLDRRIRPQVWEPFE